MGLLDDAIREHLELKRRRGADAEEVTRQEQEALGAPQRAEFAGAAPAAAAEPGSNGDGDGDDVLEETPDFLQETPEHDRLWFEQKPPRDFDFDN